MNNKTYLNKLKTFKWVGKNKNGIKEHGELQALNIRFAKTQLQSQKIIVKKIQRKYSFSLPYRYTNRIATKHINLFLRQLSTLYTSGIPLLQSLNTIAHSNKQSKFKNLVLDIQTNIKQGHPLSETLQQHTQYFDYLTYTLVLTGEQSGTLDVMLERIATHKEKIAKLKNKVKKALFYPCTVIIIAIVVTVILLMFIVPQFAELFSGFGAQLPLLTRCVIKLADLFKQFWWGILGCSIIPIWLIMFFKQRNEYLAKSFDALTLHIPIIGKLIQKSTIARLMQTLATTSATGTPLLEAIQLLKNITNNVVFKAAISQIYEDTKKGRALHNSMQTSKLFPTMTIQMIAIGEEAGKLTNMLAKAAEFYENEINQLVDELNQLLEPIIITVLGVIIGGLVIAMYLPIFRLGTII